MGMHSIPTELLCMGCMERRETAAGPCPHCGYWEERAQVPLYHLPPRTILNGKYLVGRSIGEGGFGITYLGWDLNLEMRLAIKEYYPAGYVARQSGDSYSVVPFSGEAGSLFTEGRDKFIREARNLAKFDSLPGIVRVKDFFMENGTAYIVMEYLDGVTLKAYLEEQGGRISAGEVFRLMRPVIRSLIQVHRSGLIHRDISPDNLMLLQSGAMKLLDFGAARDLANGGEKSASMTVKAGYAPEEQYRTKGEQGPWTDEYALCATIYKCITGVTPQESLERCHQDQLLPPSALGISLPPAQEQALMRGLAVRQEDRYSSLEGLESALYAREMDAEGGRIHQKYPDYDSKSGDKKENNSPKNQKSGGTSKKKNRNGLAALLAVGVLILAVVAGGITLFTGNQETESQWETRRAQQNTTAEATEEAETAETGILESQAETQEPEGETQTPEGNTQTPDAAESLTQQNLNAEFWSQEDWVYMRWADRNEVARLPEGENTVDTYYTLENMESFCVWDHWLCYLSSTDQLLYGVDLDTQNVVCLSNVPVMEGWVPILHRDSLFYLTEISENVTEIVRVDLEQLSAQTSVMGQYVAALCFYGEYMYYVTYDTASSISTLCQAGWDGSDPVQLCQLEGVVSSLEAHADGVYYGLWNGSQAVLGMCAGPGSEPFVYYTDTTGKAIGGTMRREGEPYIYFLYLNGDFTAMEAGLYRVEIREGAAPQLIHETCNETVIGPEESDYLFFVTGQEENQIVRMNGDGSGAEIWRIVEEPVLQLATTDTYLYMTSATKYAYWDYNSASTAD